MHLVGPSSESGAAILEARNLSCVFELRRFLGPSKSVHAVRGVDLAVVPGEVLGIVGESGCGKSTLARLLLGLEAPTTGEVLLQGRPLCRRSLETRRALAGQIQIVFQDTRGTLDPRKRVIDQVVEPLEIHGIGEEAGRTEKAASLLSDFGLPSHLWDRFPHQLSGGQCQRVVLARALILEPKVLVCDEPTSAADVSVQAQVVNLLREVRDRLGLTIVFISHNLAVVRHLCDRVAVMYLGRIVETGPTEPVFRAPSHPYTQSLLAAVPIPDPLRKQDWLAVSGEPPSPIDPPSGCAFHPRCPSAHDRCRAENPGLRVISSNRGAACHLLDQDEDLADLADGVEA